MSDNIDASPKNDFEAQHSAYLEKCQSRYTNAIRTLPPRLAALGVTVVSASYSGCSDAGQLDELHFYSTDHDLTGAIPRDLYKEVETFLDDALEFRHGGWENNDGGEGTFNWNLASNDFEHLHRDFYTESFSTLHNGFLDLTSTEEVDS